MKFFLSYSHSVTEQLRPIIGLLEAAGHEVWWDAAIPAGADWWSTILDHIEWCQVFVFAISEKSVQSDYCLAERRYALARYRYYLPFIIDDSSKYKIPPEIAPERQQWFPYDGNLTHLLDHIVTSIGQIQWERYPDFPALRPPEPNTGTGSLREEYLQARSLADNGHFEEAIRHFRNVARLDYPQWGTECHQWVMRLHLYSQVADLVADKYTYPRAVQNWNDYLKTYDADFDPLDLKAKLARILLSPAHSGPPIPGGPTPPPDDVVTPPPPVPAAPRRKRLSSLDILPPPFAWIRIPAGKVTLVPEAGRSGYIAQATTFDVPAFEIAKYPLTNAQFERFVNAEGYKRQQWWTDEGWQFREKEGWTEPRFWRNSKLNQPDYPVVGVCWYEAVAFSLWLSDMTSEPITLPTEQQWQRAAQGDDNRIYPWGDEFQVNRCNSSVETVSDGTTPVTRFEGKDRSDSPFGVVEMSGNVREWCLTDHETGAQDIRQPAGARVWRGATWRTSAVFVLRTTLHYWSGPDNWGDDGGFRLARSISASSQPVVADRKPDPPPHIEVITAPKPPDPRLAAGANSDGARYTSALPEVTPPVQEGIGDVLVKQGFDGLMQLVKQGRYSKETLARFITNQAMQPDLRLVALKIYIESGLQDDKMFKQLLEDSVQDIRKFMIISISERGYEIDEEVLRRVIVDPSSSDGVLEYAVKLARDLAKRRKISSDILLENRIVTHRYFIITLCAISGVIGADEPDSVERLSRFSDETYWVARQRISEYFEHLHDQNKLTDANREKAIQLLQKFVQDGKSSEKTRGKLQGVIDKLSEEVEI